MVWERGKGGKRQKDDNKQVHMAYLIRLTRKGWQNFVHIIRTAASNGYVCLLRSTGGRGLFDAKRLHYKICSQYMKQHFYSHMDAYRPNDAWGKKVSIRKTSKKSVERLYRLQRSKTESYLQR